ncbi:MAG: hypothetical protein ICV69_16290, partial [Thermoleophilaceae bacterium]|nr:hypothetical protein [Thermoleophilaceae bacterium]
VLGGATVLLDRTFAIGRGVAERLLVVFDRWLRSGGEQAPHPGSLWQRTERPQVGAGVPARESISAPAQLGAGMRPTAAVAIPLLAQARAVARKAVELRHALRRPMPERRQANEGAASGRTQRPREPAST